MYFYSRYFTFFEEYRKREKKERPIYMGNYDMKKIILYKIYYKLIIIYYVIKNQY